MESSGMQTSGDEWQGGEHTSAGTPGTNTQTVFRKVFNEKYTKVRKDFLDQREERAKVAFDGTLRTIKSALSDLNRARESRESKPVPVCAGVEEVRPKLSQKSQLAVKTASTGVAGKNAGGEEAKEPESSASTVRQLELTENVRVKFSRTAPGRLHKGFKLPKAATIPAYTAWVYIPKNQRDQDNDRRMFYTDEIGETVPASDEEVEYEFWYWNGKDIHWRNFCLEKLRDEFGETKELKEALAEKLKVDSDAIDTRFREMASTGLEEVEVDRVGGKVEDGHNAFHQAFCRRCGLYECRVHGGSHVMPNKPQDRLPLARTLSPCGSECYLAFQDASQGEDAPEPPGGGGLGSSEQKPDEEMEEAGSSAGSKWTNVEKGFISQGVLMFGPNPCEIARMFATKTCNEVNMYLEQNPSVLNLRHPQQNQRKKVVRRRTFNNRKGPLVVQKRFRHNEAELWHSYTPCNCKNGCNNSCSCYQTKNFCEKYCACWPGCANQWKGCKCSHRCDTQRCPCVSASRECDPDYCHLCKKTCEPGCPPDEHCKNMNLRLRKHKRVAMGLSTVAGWGGFLMEDAKKDDFLGEYTGDLITDQEAERRGRIYDRQDKSYLFNLTKEKVLDANRRGNKLRFANHSKDPNCYVKYMLVDGDHRVGIFAGRDAKAGEEIFYDYGGAWCSKWYDPEGAKD
ncbi:hypothetical protein BSKO_06437 [Bryopsis sp. KO-2023]|nr:hypothetical protein BSKO_06437 [Bryopsis sp. KO-2023]